ncbi:MAG: hypothetical protein GXP08_16280 [Gammaproteobacteria bacterium]|nr:hypothetical protein [Gammaproteobacteria bacterium]
MKIGPDYLIPTLRLLIRGASRYLFSSLWCCGISLPFSAVIADDLSLSEPLSILTSSYSLDSNGGQNLFLYVNLTIKAQQSLMLGLGGSNQTLLASNEQRETNTYLIGYAVAAGRSVTFGLEYERWGEEETLIMDVLRFNLGVDVQDWSLTVTPQWRKIILDMEVRNRQFEVVSSGLALDIDYLGIDQWFLSIGYRINNYSKDLVVDKRKINNRIFLSFFNQLQSVTDRKQLSLGVGYYIDTETLGISWLRAESAIDTSETGTVTLFFSSDLLNDWSVTLSLGQQYYVGGANAEFLGGSLTYYW